MGNQVSVSNEGEPTVCGSFSFWKGHNHGRNKSLFLDVVVVQQDSDDTYEASATTSSDDCSLWDPYSIRRIPSTGSWLSLASSSPANANSPSFGAHADDTQQHLQQQQQQQQRRSTSSITDYTAEELLLSDTEATPASDLTLCPRQVWIVTTAALPWMTGTAVNPLLRAAYLAQRQRDTASSTVDVHLVLPWLENASDREALYGGATTHGPTCHDQEKYIQQWLCDNVHDYTIDLVQIHWYPARYHAKLGSIFAMGDVCALLQPVTADAICILEEPEHLNYYRGGHWRTKFAHVAGVIHTNYCQYAEQHYANTHVNNNKKYNRRNSDNNNNSSSTTTSVGKLVAAPLVGAISAWMVRAYCDKVVQLSATLPSYAPEKEVVANVHGVRAEFFEQQQYYETTSGCESNTTNTSTGGPSQQQPHIYFLGKLLWAKGLDKMLQLQHHCKYSTGHFFAMDVYGSGPDQEEIQQAFQLGYMGRLRRGSGSHSSKSHASRSYSERAVAYLRGECKNEQYQDEQLHTSIKNPLPVHFLGRADHAQIDRERLQNGYRRYKIFVNPSVSEVLCTVTAEAIAMGKFVIIPDHPSNTFFQQFPNCLHYSTDDEFLHQLEFALHNEPTPLSETSQDALTWQGATDRLCQAVAISHRAAARRDRLRARDQRLADWHIQLGTGTTGDVLRHVLGGGPVANQSRYKNASRSNSSSSLLLNATNHGNIMDGSVRSLSRSSSSSVTSNAAGAPAVTTTAPTVVAIAIQC